MFLSYMFEAKNRKAEKVVLSDINKDNVMDFLRWLVETRVTVFLLEIIGWLLYMHL